MKQFFLITLFLLSFSSCCNEYRVRSQPQYNGVAPEFRTYVRDYKQLAAQRHVYFNKMVTIGMSQVGHNSDIIGLCTTTYLWREIEIDREFWKYAGPTSKRMLLYHELSHCYCGRDHDYSPGKLYPNRAGYPPLIVGANQNEQDPVHPGYFKDGCALSIMHPQITPDYCAEVHENYYIDEIFQNCQPW